MQIAILHFNSLTDMKRAYKILKHKNYKPQQVGTLYLLNVNESDLENEYFKIKELLAEENITPLWIESEEEMRNRRFQNTAKKKKSKWSVRIVE